MKNSIAFLTISLMISACIAQKNPLVSNVSLTEQLRIHYENGNISKDIYYTYLTYSVFAQDSLPKKYDGKLAPRDATPIIRQIKRAFPGLSPETQEHLKQWIKPLPSKPTKLDRKQ